MFLMQDHVDASPYAPRYLDEDTALIADLVDALDQAKKYNKALPQLEDLVAQIYPFEDWRNQNVPEHVPPDEVAEIWRRHLTSKESPFFNGRILDKTGFSIYFQAETGGTAGSEDDAWKAYLLAQVLEIDKQVAYYKGKFPEDPCEITTLYERHPQILRLVCAALAVAVLSGVVLPPLIHPMTSHASGNNDTGPDDDGLKNLQPFSDNQLPLKMTPLTLVGPVTRDGDKSLHITTFEMYPTTPGPGADIEGYVVDPEVVQAGDNFTVTTQLVFIPTGDYTFRMDLPAPVLSYPDGSKSVTCVISFDPDSGNTSGNTIYAGGDPVEMELPLTFTIDPSWKGTVTAMIVPRIEDYSGWNYGPPWSVRIIYTDTEFLPVIGR